MITGAAAATINRLPVLLLPGDIFARRNVAPVLQQLESVHSQDISVNDCFRPVSRYWDRIYRPEQLITALPAAMQVLTSPAETGAVTLAMPQDVQAEAYDYPEELLAPRVWLIRRPQPDTVSLAAAVDAIRQSRTPLVIAGGGVLYSEASQALAFFASQTGTPVAETYAGKGSLPFDFAQNVGAIGSTGTRRGKQARSRRRPDYRHRHALQRLHYGVTHVVPASERAFRERQRRRVRRHKASAIPVVADARVALEELAAALHGHRAAPIRFADRRVARRVGRRGRSALSSERHTGRRKAKSSAR